MKKFLLLSLLVAAPLQAQIRTEIFFDAEGVHRTGTTRSFSPGVVRLDPAFNNAGGIGAGLNFYFSDRVSLEAKVAALQGRSHLTVIGQDTVVTVNLGNEQVYPVSAVLQWHPIEHGTLRPYLGAGVVHTILHNINRQIPSAGVTGVRFRDPTGLVVDGGLGISLGGKWSLYGDARYVPLETKSRVTFVGSPETTEISVRPLIVSFGASYRF